MLSDKGCHLQPNRWCNSRRYHSQHHLCDGFTPDHLHGILRVKDFPGILEGNITHLTYIDTSDSNSFKIWTFYVTQLGLNFNINPNFVKLSRYMDIDLH